MANTRNFRHPPGFQCITSSVLKEYFWVPTPSIFKTATVHLSLWIRIEMRTRDGKQMSQGIPNHSQSYPIYIFPFNGSRPLLQINVGCSSSPCLPHLQLVSLIPSLLYFPLKKVSETAPLVWRRKSAGSTTINENPDLGVLPCAKQKCPGITV